MRLLIISFVFGAAVGCGYALFGVRSPAPSAAALLGLLGMLLGEQSLRLLPKRPPAAAQGLQPETEPGCKRD